jgi:hypothetical protein
VTVMILSDMINFVLVTEPEGFSWRVVGSILEAGVSSPLMILD